MLLFFRVWTSPFVTSNVNQLNIQPYILEHNWIENEMAR
jgi:hypothetical protein